MRNRLHSRTRWPRNPRDRLELAQMDIDYCVAMERILGDKPELVKIRQRAYCVKKQLPKEQ